MAEKALPSVELTEADIPGSALSEPLEASSIPQLRWWLLCHGICAPTSWKKQLNKYNYTNIVYLFYFLPASTLMFTYA